MDYSGARRTYAVKDDTSGWCGLRAGDKLIASQSKFLILPLVSYWNYIFSLKFEAST
jgi:hypothetical protein